MTDPRDKNKMSGWGHAQDSIFDRALRNSKSRSLPAKNVYDTNETDVNKLLSQSLQPSIFAKKQEGVNLTVEEMEKLCFYDSLTQTYNYKYVMRKIRQEVYRAVRYQRWLTVMVVSVDSYLEYFEQVGFLGLDYLLLKISNIIIGALRKDIDLIGRYGDNRFIIALPETPPEGAIIVANRIINNLERCELQYQWFRTKATVSIGISFYPGHAHTAPELVALADIVCDQANLLGGDGVYVCPD